MWDQKDSVLCSCAIKGKIHWIGDFAGGPVAKTLRSPCRGSRFDSWSGN